MTNLLERDVKGRYRTFADLGFGKSLSTLLKQALYRNDAFEEMSKVDIENMRRT